MKKVWKIITDNFVVYLLVTFVLIQVGALLGSLFTDIPIGIYTGHVLAEQGVDMYSSTETSAELVEEYSDVLTEAIPDWITTGALYFSFIGIWILALLWFLKKANRPIYKAITPKSPGNNIKNLLLGLLIGAVMNGACAVISILNGDIILYFDSFRPVEMLLVLIAVFIQSSAEELLCRGYLYQKLMHKYKKPAVAIVGNAVLFAALHLGNPGVSPMAIVDLITTGICFSLMVYYCDSIWMAMGAHTAWNYLQNIVLGLPNSGQVEPFSMFKLAAASARNGIAYNVNFGIEGSVMSVIVQVIPIIILLYLIKKNGPKATDIWAEYDAAIAEKAAAEATLQAEEE